MENGEIGRGEVCLGLVAQLESGPEGIFRSGEYPVPAA